MNTHKKLIALGMSLLILCGTVTTASAYVYKLGTVFQTVTVKDIPGGGRVKYDTYYGSKKSTDGYFATFKKTHGDAWLGNFAELIDKNEFPKSEPVGIPLNKPELAQELGCSKGTVYFVGITSSIIEPSNKCDVTVQFSADDLKK